MSGSQIQGKFVNDSAITAAKLASNAVEEAKINAGAVTETKIGSGAVTETKIGSNAVTSGKIAADAVTDAKIRLANNAFLRGRNAADSADVDMIKVNASDVLEFASIPQASGTPTNANDLVNKSYADTLVGGAGVSKKAVHFVVDGSGDPLVVGTGSSYDGYTPSVGDRFLYVGSFDANSERGIYEVTGAATSARAADANSAGEFEFGQSVTVKSGNLYSGAQFVLMTSTAITLGTTVLDYRRLNEWNYEILTLAAGDITNQYVNLAFKAQPFSVQLYVNGARQFESAEFSMSVVGGVSRLAFLGVLATGGAAELVSGDELRIQYVKGF